jgi:hypothetical protein
MRLISRKIILEYNEDLFIKSQGVRVGLKFAKRILKNIPRSQT